MNNQPDPFNSFDSKQFGQRDRFAVSLDVATRASDYPPWCRFGYWIDGIYFTKGDWYAADDLLNDIRVLTWYTGKREACEVFALHTRILFEETTRILLGQDRDCSARIELTSAERHKMWVHPSIGDGWMLLFSCGGLGRLIFADSVTSPPRELRCVISEVESTIEEFVACVEELVAAL